VRRSFALIGLLGLLSACVARRHDPAVRGLPLDDPQASFSAVWIGHATVLMRFGRQRVLADPNLSGAIPRLSPRDAAVGAPNELPPIDVVLLSHMHVDHFDLRTVRALGRRPVVLFPVGGAPYMDAVRQRKLPMKPWETREVRGLRITAVPVAHAGGRYALDAFWNHGYTGYVIEGGAARSSSLATRVGTRKKFRSSASASRRSTWPSCPSRRRAAATRPRQPQGALDIFRAVGARLLVPIHYEAYYSSLVPYDEAAQGAGGGDQEARPRGPRRRAAHRRAAGAAGRPPMRSRGSRTNCRRGGAAARGDAAPAKPATPKSGSAGDGAESHQPTE